MTYQSINLDKTLTDFFSFVLAFVDRVTWHLLLVLVGGIYGFNRGARKLAWTTQFKNTPKVFRFFEFRIWTITDYLSKYTSTINCSLFLPETQKIDSWSVFLLIVHDSSVSKFTYLIVQVRNSINRDTLDVFLTLQSYFFYNSSGRKLTWINRDSLHVFLTLHS